MGSEPVTPVSANQLWHPHQLQLHPRRRSNIDRTQNDAFSHSVSPVRRSGNEHRGAFEHGARNSVLDLFRSISGEGETNLLHPDSHRSRSRSPSIQLPPINMAQNRTSRPPSQISFSSACEMLDPAWTHRLHPHRVISPSDIDLFPQISAHSSTRDPSPTRKPTSLRLPPIFPSKDDEYMDIEYINGLPNKKSYLAKNPEMREFLYSQRH